MEKCNYFITGSDGKNESGEIIYKFTPVSGWMETFRAPDGTEIKIAAHKDRYYGWILDEMTTGYSVSPKGEQTIGEAFSKLTENLLDAISKRIRQDDLIRAQTSLKAHIAAERNQ